MDDTNPQGDPAYAALANYAHELAQTFSRLQEEAPKLQQQVFALQGTAKSGDELVTATVGARGELTHLEIDPRVYRRPDSKKLAATISEAVNKAQAKAQQDAMELLAPIVPRERIQAQLDGNLDELAAQMERHILGERLV